ncbi:MAG TPA: hydroxyisourate hydrolase [Candidatus Tyrphobacter sp.]
MPLSTHVLDLAGGVPASDLAVSLFRIDGDARPHVASALTDANGRIAAPFGGNLAEGVYELIFSVGDYYAQQSTGAFYADVPVRFRIDDAAANYHVPLLLSPWGYSTYRGS